MPSAAASAAATVGSSLIGANAAGSASKAASKAAAENAAFLHGVYSDASGNLQPTITQGKQAGGVLSGLLGIGGDPAASQRAFDTFRDSSNYGFLFDQGTQAVKTANAPSFNSGATAKALINYGQGQAGNALAGYENMLSGQQTLGANSALGLGQIGSGIGQTLTGSNNANAGAQGSAAQALGGALSGGLNGLNSVFQSARTGSSFGGGDAGVFGNVGSGTFGPNTPYDFSGQPSPQFNSTGMLS